MDALKFTKTWVLAVYSRYNNPKIRPDDGEWTVGKTLKHKLKLKTS